MRQKNSKPPRTQRAFRSPWLELEYLCKKVHYWLHTRNETARAARYTKRLGKVLRAVPDDDLAIVRQEGLALFHELCGDLRAAIQHREREISLIHRLHELAHLPGCQESTRVFMLRGHGSRELQERQAILAALKKASAPADRQPSAKQLRGAKVA